MEHFWDLLFQLMKHGTNTLHVAFVFLFSVVMQPIKYINQGIKRQEDYFPFSYTYEYFSHQSEFLHVVNVPIHTLICRNNLE